MRVRVRSRGKSELLEQRISCEPDAVETIESVGKIEIDVPESPPDWDK